MDVWTQKREKSKGLDRSESFNGIFDSGGSDGIKEKKLTRSKSLPGQWSPSRKTASNKSKVFSAWKLLGPFFDPHRRKKNQKMDVIQLGGKSGSDKMTDAGRVGVGGMDHACVGSSSSRTSYPPVFKEKKKKNVEKKKKFSWWPDASQRWPVQGW